jgi:hypothetical protein
MPKKVERLLRRLHYRLGDGYYHLRNRLFARYYLIDLKAMGRGEWRDTDYRLFEAVFQLLVDFVENECAHLSKICYDSDSLHDPETHPAIREWHAVSRWNRWKNRQQWNERLGMAHLEWEATLDDPSRGEFERNYSQAEKGRKSLELYRWYKYERPKRVDPWEAYPEPEAHYVHEKTGEPLPGKFKNMMESEQTEDGYWKMRELTEPYREYLDKGAKLEQDQYQEDTERAQQVLAIRQGLWT